MPPDEFHKYLEEVAKEEGWVPPEEREAPAPAPQAEAPAPPPDEDPVAFKAWAIERGKDAIKEALGDAREAARAPNRTSPSR